MLQTPTTLAGDSLLDEADTEQDCVAMEEASDLSDDAGPIIDNKTGNNTRPWNKPNITVKQNT